MKNKQLGRSVLILYYTGRFYRDYFCQRYFNSLCSAYFLVNCSIRWLRKLNVGSTPGNCHTFCDFDCQPDLGNGSYVNCCSCTCYSESDCAKHRRAKTFCHLISRKGIENTNFYSKNSKKII